MSGRLTCLAYINLSRSEQAPVGVIQHFFGVTKVFFWTSETSLIYPERYGSCGLYELLMHNVYHQMNKN